MVVSVKAVWLSAVDASGGRLFYGHDLTADRKKVFVGDKVLSAPARDERLLVVSVYSLSWFQAYKPTHYFVYR